MPDPSEKDLTELGSFRHWKPEYQERALDLLEERKDRPWRPFYCRRAACDGLPHGEWAWNHARADQHPPKWYADWLTWFLCGGRGSGKTRAGAEVTHRATDLYPRIIMIAPTNPDFRDIMVEGESGLLETAHPDRRPFYEPSKKKLTWPNGAIGLGFSAEEPDRLRGKQSAFIWAEEAAHYPDPDRVWKMALFGHRLKGKKGAQPKILLGSTPKPTTFIKERIADPKTVVTRVSSYANIDNLAESYRINVLDPHKGTRIGRQELEGEVLEDVEGALWNWDMFKWQPEAPPLRRVITAVDPAGSVAKRADLTGIIVLGIGFDNVVYVLADYTGKYTPGQWGDKVLWSYEFHQGDAVVAEKNYGNLMVRHTLETSRLSRSIMPMIKLVDSRRGKAIRAEPVVALYEKNTNEVVRIVHVGPRGSLADLEDEQTSWVPDEDDSPNRIDALVHGVTELTKNIRPGQVASPSDVGAEDRAAMEAGMSVTQSGLLIPTVNGYPRAMTTSYPDYLNAAESLFR